MNSYMSLGLFQSTLNLEIHSLLHVAVGHYFCSSVLFMNIPKLIHSAVDEYILFWFGAISNNTMNIVVHVFVHCVYFSIGEYLLVELLADRICMCSALVETTKHFPKVFVLIYTQLASKG